MKGRPSERAKGWNKSREHQRSPIGEGIANFYGSLVHSRRDKQAKEEEELAPPQVSPGMVRASRQPVGLDIGQWDQSQEVKVARSIDNAQQERQDGETPPGEGSGTDQKVSEGNEDRPEKIISEQQNREREVAFSAESERARVEPDALPNMVPGEDVIEEIRGTKDGEASAGLQEQQGLVGEIHREEVGNSFSPDLLIQDVALWNQRRRNYPEILPDLRAATLAGIVLKEANLSNLNLSGANLRSASLNNADLRSANLSGANLSGAALRGANLSGADLRNSSLFRANLIHANLSDANLSGADLREAVLHSTDLREIILTEISIYRTIFGDVDLSTAKGLETVRHLGESVIGIETIMRSQGYIPASFLRGAGVQERFITAICNPAGTSEEALSGDEKREATGELIEGINCICYAEADGAFAESLFVDLQNRGVACRLIACDGLGDDAVRSLNYDRLLLVLSAYTLRCPWLQIAVETAFDREARQGRSVLMLLRVDETPLMFSRSWMMIAQKWAIDAHMVQHVHDFVGLERGDRDNKDYQEAMEALLQDIAIMA